MDSGRGVPDGTDTDVGSPAAGDEEGNSEQQRQMVLTWKPNEFLQDSLIQMGITPVAAKKALFFTKNVSTEAAIEWIFGDPSQRLDLETPLEVEMERDPGLFEALGAISYVSGPSASQTGAASSANDAEDEDDEDDDLYKMVFVVNAELSMGVGKIAAQVAHAALGLHRILLQHQAKYGESLLNWAEYGETKIVLRGETTDHLIDLEHKAIDGNLPCYLVHDAGKTQVKAGSTTVLSIFGSNKRVDKVTGSLKLY